LSALSASRMPRLAVIGRDVAAMTMGPGALVVMAQIWGIVSTASYNSRGATGASGERPTMTHITASARARS